MLEHLAKGEDGNYYRIKGTENNASKILKLLNKKEQNNITNNKIISDLKAKSITALIEAGADVSKPVKYRIEAVKEAFTAVLNELVPDNANDIFDKILFGHILIILKKFIFTRI